MIKYMEMIDLNKDQIKAIEEYGWCVFTECDEGGSYFNKGLSWVNRIGYIIMSENVSVDYIDSYRELHELATYDSDFDKKVRTILNPLKDECYVFLVKEPAHYHFEQIWTNKGLKDAKEIAKYRFHKFKHTYYESKDFDKMDKLINRHNNKVKRDTEVALNLLKENGFKVISEKFAVIK